MSGPYAETTIRFAPSAQHGLPHARPACAATCAKINGLGPVFRAEIEAGRTGPARSFAETLNTPSSSALLAQTRAIYNSGRFPHSAGDLANAVIQNAGNISPSDFHKESDTLTQKIAEGSTRLTPAGLAAEAAFFRQDPARPVISLLPGRSPALD